MRERAAIGAEIAFKSSILATSQRRTAHFERKTCRPCPNFYCERKPFSQILESGILFRACQPVRYGAEGKGDCILTAAVACGTRHHAVDDGLGYRTGGSANPPIREGVERNGGTSAMT
ncbi:hypothetical protein AGR6A_pAt20027 [Agrobacterium sp. NCPPB 925]|nr:hypothetical protein AGR6A_pAt20027 [Agrobacterium sp. NCPPB 925]